MDSVSDNTDLFVKLKFFFYKIYRIWESFCVGELLRFEWKIAIHGKTFAVAFCRLILLIDMAMICGKTFAVA